MSLNETPSGERIQIGFFGRRNAGKSSLVNAVTRQELSVVSDTLGTTTDAVTKAMELLPMGPVVIIDTPGFDDEGSLGEKRVKKTKQVLARADIAVLVADVTQGLGSCEKELIELFQKQNIPYIIAWNKADLLEHSCTPEAAGKEAQAGGKTASEKNVCELPVSAITGYNIEQLKETIARMTAHTENSTPLVSDLVKKMDTVVLVIPIDESAPKGRLILPQQQVIRELLEVGAVSVCVKETELADLLAKMAPGRPDLVITDSQAFYRVAADVPQDVKLTSFSILMARHKGFLDTAVAGASALDSLKAGDTVLIAEGCTHHRQCNDIGSVKIPRWLKAHAGQELSIETCSGRDFPEDLSKYALVIHCGGCMVNGREVQYRMKSAISQGIPFTNYGTAIAHMNGILRRSIQIIYPAGKDKE
jgi:[FeFe] hydrogenase H-cluster maturation GTPase HydF